MAVGDPSLKTKVKIFILVCGRFKCILISWLLTTQIIITNDQILILILACFHSWLVIDHLSLGKVYNMTQK